MVAHMAHPKKPAPNRATYRNIANGNELKVKRIKVGYSE
jgi:hypothetical protein